MPRETVVRFQLKIRMRPMSPDGQRQSIDETAAVIDSRSAEAQIDRQMTRETVQKESERRKTRVEAQNREMRSEMQSRESRRAQPQQDLSANASVAHRVSSPVERAERPVDVGPSSSMPDEVVAGGFVTKDLRFTDDSDSSMERQTANAPSDDVLEADEAELISKPQQELATVSDKGSGHQISNKPRRMIDLSKMVLPESTGKQPAEIHYKREDEETPADEVEALEPVVPPSGPQLRKCCDCCQRHRRRVVKLDVIEVAEDANAIGEGSTIGSARDRVATGLAPTFSMDRHGQNPIKEHASGAVEVQCPVCSDTFNVIVGTDIHADDTFSGIPVVNWREKTKERQKRK